MIKHSINEGVEKIWQKVIIYQDMTRYTCQVGATQLQNGDVVVVFNEARGKAHLDFDSTVLLRSTDNGETFAVPEEIPIPAHVVREGSLIVGCQPRGQEGGGEERGEGAEHGVHLTGEQTRGRHRGSEPVEQRRAQRPSATDESCRPHSP